MKALSYILSIAIVCGGQDVRLPQENRARIWQAHAAVEHFVGEYNRWAEQHNDLIWNQADVKLWRNTVGAFREAEREMKAAGY